MGCIKAAVFITVCFAMLAGLVETSQSFQNCVHQRKEHEAYHALHEKSPLLIVTVVRFELTAACARVTAGKNDGAIVAIGTLVLAFFTFALWRSTDKLWLAADRQRADTLRSIEANEALATSGEAQAETSKQALIATFRPRLVVRRISLEPATPGRPLKIEWIVANIGGTPATILESNATIKVAGHSVLDPIPEYSEETHSMKNVTIEPGVGFPMIQYDSRNLREWEDDEQAGRLKFIYFMGYIQYRDGIGVKRFMAFCRRHNRQTRRFEVVDDPNYEYAD